MKKKVLINVTFKDRYTGKLRVAGKTAEMTEERVREVNEVNPNFVSVIGNVPETNNGKDQTDGNNADNSGNGTTDDGKSKDK